MQVGTPAYFPANFFNFFQDVCKSSCMHSGLQIDMINWQLLGFFWRFCFNSFLTLSSFSKMCKQTTVCFQVYYGGSPHFFVFPHCKHPDDPKFLSPSMSTHNSCWHSCPDDTYFLYYPKHHQNEGEYDKLNQITRRWYTHILENTNDNIF